MKRKSFRSSFPRAVSRPIQIDGNFHKGFNEKDIRIKIRLFPLFDCTERESAHRIMIKNMRERERRNIACVNLCLFMREWGDIYIYMHVRERKKDRMDDLWFVKWRHHESTSRSLATQRTYNKKKFFVFYILCDTVIIINLPDIPWKIDIGSGRLNILWIFWFHFPSVDSKGNNLFVSRVIRLNVERENVSTIYSPW